MLNKSKLRWIWVYQKSNDIQEEDAYENLPAPGNYLNVLFPIFQFNFISINLNLNKKKINLLLLNIYKYFKIKLFKNHNDNCIQGDKRHPLSKKNGVLFI